MEAQIVNANELRKLKYQESGRRLGLSNSKYKPEYNDKVIDLMKSGKSKVEVAAELDITEDTLYDWIKRQNLFRESIKKGEVHLKKWWIEKGKEAIDKRYYQASMFVWMTKNILGWADREEITHSGEMTIKIAPRVNSYQQVKEVKNSKSKSPIINKLASGDNSATLIKAKTQS